MKFLKKQILFLINIKKSVCKIILRKGYSTGFFFKIKDLIGVLITTNKVLKEINSIPEKEIKIIIKGKISILSIYEDRKIFKFLEKNIIMIRMKEYDNLDIEYLYQYYGIEEEYNLFEKKIYI